MTVTIGRRELLVALGGAGWCGRWQRARSDRGNSLVQGLWICVGFIGSGPCWLALLPIPPRRI